jgi:hypothetical protein
MVNLKCHGHDGGGEIPEHSRTNDRMQLQDERLSFDCSVMNFESPLHIGRTIVDDCWSETRYVVTAHTC